MFVLSSGDGYTKYTLKMVNSYENGSKETTSKYNINYRSNIVTHICLCFKQTLFEDNYK